MWPKVAAVRGWLFNQQIVNQPINKFMNTLAVIIARAGSKGLPNKAMQPLMGRPLIEYTIEHAMGSKRVDQVVLSSDSEAIVEAGRRHWIHSYLRPAHRASDLATIDDGVRHGVECWEAEFGRQCRYVAILYGNIPIRPTDLTDRAMQKLIETEADSVQSVYNVGKMHPLWMKKLGGTFGDVLEMYEENRVYRRQDLPPVFMLDAGVLAVTRVNLFNVNPAEPHQFLGTDRRAVVTRPGDVVDVDDPLDLALAETIMRQRMKA